VQRLRRDGLQVLGRFTGGWRREDGDQVPPRRAASYGNGGGGISDQKETRQAENTPYETENHPGQGSEARRLERVFDKAGDRGINAGSFDELAGRGTFAR
jgi:hypothetical protein